MWQFFLEQLQVHHKTGVAGAEYAQVLTCTAFPKSSIPTRGHVCSDWPPRVQSFTGVHSWVHIPHCLDKSWHAPTTTARCSIGSLSSPHLPPPKPWQPPSLYCLHGFVFPRCHTVILSIAHHHVSLSWLPSFTWSWAFKFATVLACLNSSFLFSMKNIRPKIPYILIPHLGYKF